MTQWGEASLYFILLTTNLYVLNEDSALQRLTRHYRRKNTPHRMRRLLNPLFHVLAQLQTFYGPSIKISHCALTALYSLSRNLLMISRFSLCYLSYEEWCMLLAVMIHLDIQENLPNLVMKVGKELEGPLEGMRISEPDPNFHVRHLKPIPHKTHIRMLSTEFDKGNNNPCIEITGYYISQALHKISGHLNTVRCAKKRSYTEVSRAMHYLRAPVVHNIELYPVEKPRHKNKKPPTVEIPFYFRKFSDVMKTEVDVELPYTL